MSFNEVMSDDHGLYKWLSNIVSDAVPRIGVGADCLQDSFGFSFISDVPVSTEATERLAERIGFIRETQCASATCCDPITVLNNLPARREVLGVHVRPIEGRHGLHDHGAWSPH